MDLILRNAYVLGDSEAAAQVDIGIDRGRIAAIAPGLAAGGREIDLGGRLVAPSFIETHIPLDKSCILERCKSEKGDLEEAIEQVALAKKQFTADDCYERAKRTLENHSEQHRAHAHSRRSRSGRRPAASKA
jgi:cytosine deaminase